MSGALEGLRVVELGGIGPVPFTGMMLADAGATVTRIERPGPEDAQAGSAFPPDMSALNRGKVVVEIDARSEDGREAVIALADESEVFIEGFRPGVLERLDLGPKRLFSSNPSLVIARVTGWGQCGAFSQLAGHDINYIGVSGALSITGTPDGALIPPGNLIGDFAGGSYVALFGILAALLEARQTGVGQVLDSNMVEGSAMLVTLIKSWQNLGAWSSTPGTNFVDGGAPFYRTYCTSDGKLMALGAIESVFFRRFIDAAGLDEQWAQRQMDLSSWAELTFAIETRLLEETRAYWTEVGLRTDCCLTPVYSLDEVADVEPNAERDSFLDSAFGKLPRPVPRFGRHPVDGHLPPADTTVGRFR